MCCINITLKSIINYETQEPHFNNLEPIRYPIKQRSVGNKVYYDYSEELQSLEASTFVFKIVQSRLNVQDVSKTSLPKHPSNLRTIQSLEPPVSWRPVLTHWGREEMDAITQTTFSSAFFLKENVWIPTIISLKFVPKGPINNIPALVQIMAWRRPGDKTLSEPMMVSLLTHIRVTRPQWVKGILQQDTFWDIETGPRYDQYTYCFQYTLIGGFHRTWYELL